MDISKTKLDDLGTMSGIEGDSGSEVVLPAGKVVADRFEIVGVIGRGGMGTVYEVYDQMREEQGALKFLRPEFVSSDNARQRFLNEAKIAISLSHPHIISVYDVVKYENTCFLTMELLKGQNLRQRLQELSKAGQQMPLDEAVSIIKDLCEALAYAHKSTIHRDVKPENIWILPDGRAKLMDFGIARLQDQTSNLKTAGVLGTAYYMAPEQVVGAGQVDHRADQYSLGVVFYEMLTGRLPIGRHAPVSVIRKDISKKVDTVIGAMMSGNAGERYASDIVLLNALNALPRSGTKMMLPTATGKVVGVALAVMLSVVVGYGGLQWMDQRAKAEAIRQAEEKTKTEALAKAKREENTRAEALAKAKQADDDGWSRAQKDGKLESYQTYLSQFQTGAHGVEAKKELDRLKLAQAEAAKIAQQEQQVGRAAKASAAAQVANSRYVIKGDTVYDKNTNLTWQRCGVGQHWNGNECAGEVKEFSFDDAQQQGRGTWRVPTKDELATLIDGRRSGLYEVAAFPNTVKWYWSSTCGARDGFCWGIYGVYSGNFGEGGMGEFIRRYSYAVRLVRGGQ